MTSSTPSSASSTRTCRTGTRRPITRSSAPTSQRAARSRALRRRTRPTIVFHLTQNYGATFAQALTLPGHRPRAERVAGPMDKKTPSTYDSEVTKQAFSGPYMISEYASGRSLTLVRNPNWKADTDYRPAYADTIVWKAGGDAERARAPDAQQPRSADGRRAAGARAQDRLHPEQGPAVDRDAGPVLRLAEHDAPAVRRHQPAEGRDRDLRSQRLPARPRRQAGRPGGHALPRAGGPWLPGVRRRQRLRDRLREQPGREPAGRPAST